MAVYRVSGLDRYIPRIELSYTSYFVVVSGLCLIPALVIALFALRDWWTEGRQPRGCRKLGLRGQSNIADEHDAKYDEGTESDKKEPGKTTWRVKSLWIYPVKSCRGVELNRGTVVGTGMQYDRQFSFAQLKTEEAAADWWKFITQREFPLLARVRTEVWVPDPSSSTYSPKEPFVQSGGALVITFPFEEDGWKGALQRLIANFEGSEARRSITLPFNPTADQIKANGYTMEKMKIWKDCPQALNMSASLPPELQHFIGVKGPFALFRVAQGHERRVYKCAPKEEQLGYQPITGFADSYPLSLMNLASVHDVAARLPEGVPRLSVSQYRPNIIITGPQKYPEDAWKLIRIGEFVYYVAARTTRCMLPNTNQVTGVAHPREPNITMKSFRCIDEGAKATACLGMQMVPALHESRIKVGDVIELLETGEHFALKV